MGVSSMSGPTPNRGYEAAVAQRVGSVIPMLLDSVKLVGATSEMGRKLLKIITSLSDIAPPGSVSPAAQKNQLEQQQMRNAQNMETNQQIRPGAGGGPPGAGAGGPPGGGAAGMMGAMA